MHNQVTIQRCQGQQAQPYCWRHKHQAKEQTHEAL